MQILKNLFLRVKRAEGYNLLQMAIAILVLAALTTPFLTLYNLQQNQRRIDATEQNMDNVVSAIQNYKRLYGLFPCPAPMKISRSDPAYGHEVGFNDPSALACRDTATQAILPGHCGSGSHDVCVQIADATRTTALNTPSVVPAISNRVIIGAIPFRLLQVDEAKTIDGYGSKFVYAVTESLTDAEVFKEKNGAIKIVDGSNNSNTNPESSASFAVMSMGPDQAGGITLEGVEHLPCPTTGATLDADNCALSFDPGSTYPQIAMYRDAYQNTAPGLQHYDDKINYFVNQDDPLWRRTLTDNENIQDMSTQNVGINTTTPPSDIQLDIQPPTANVDTIRLNGTNSVLAFESTANGRVLADTICDSQSATSCFEPSLFGSSSDVGAPTRLQCPVGQAMIAISGGAPICKDMSTIGGFTCPAATPLLYSYTSPTVYDCRAMPAPPVSCPATTVSLNLCTTANVALPSTPALGTYTVNRGSCANAVYTCRANGTWRTPPTISGQCPASTTSNVVTACGFGFTGSNTTTNTTTCTSSTTTTTSTSTASTCVCVGASRGVTRSCASDLGSNFTGTQTATETATPPSCALTTGAWDKSACVCVANSTGTRTCASDPAFGVNFAGNETRTVTRTLPSCTPVTSAWNTSACTCAGNTTETRACSADPAFGAGYSGNETRTITRSGATCTPVTSAWDTSACGCGLTTLTSTAHHTCANPLCETYNPADDDVFRQTVNTTSCSYNVPSQTHVGSCLSISFHWKDLGTVGSPGGAFPPDRVDIEGGCTCAQSGTVSTSCYDPSDSSRQPHRCVCQ